MRKNVPFYKKIAAYPLMIMFFLMGTDIAISADFETTNIEERNISGTVVDENNEPIPGVNIFISSMTVSTVTDLDGNYSISVPDNTETLLFSFVGYKTQELRIGTQVVINVNMVPDIEVLDQVIVVGYGTQKKADITGSVASFDAVRLEEMPAVNIQQALQGTISGLNVSVNSNSASGSDNSINIRGKRSIDGDSDPLIILDGIVFSGSIAEINMNDIGSIQVLKDASSSAIYGSRGANGVIIITSKKGTYGGKPRVSYNGYFGIDEIYDLPDMMDAETFYNRKVERFGEAHLDETERGVWERREGVDWVDLALRQGKKQEHNLSVSGGTDEVKYYLSGNYQDVEGVAIGDNFSKVNFRANLSVNVTNWLEIGTNTLVGFADRSGIGSSFSGAFFMNPLTLPFEEDGTLSKRPWPEDVGFSNPLENTLYDNSDKSNSLFTNNYLLIQVPFIKGLSYKLNSGYTARGRKEQTYRGRNTLSGSELNGFAIHRTTDRRDWLLENILSFEHTYGRHSIFVTGLYSAQERTDELLRVQAQDFPNDFSGFDGLRDANPEKTELNSDDDESPFLRRNNVSQMLRINYNYNSKYLLTLTGRRDGYSAFGVNSKFGFFPSAAIGWNLHQETFIKRIRQINQLKLRTSYGDNGNQAVSPNITLAAFRKRDYIDGEGGNLVGYVPDRLASPLLGWETTTSLNVGLDFGLLESRINGSLDIYNSRTTGLLLNKSIPSINGATSIIQNIGETKGNGVELSLQTVNVKSENFEWNTQFAFTKTRNEIVHIGLTDSLGNYIDDIGSRWFIGQPIDVNFGYVNNGVWQTADVAGVNLNDFGVSQAGDVKYADLNGDEKINEEDRQVIGSLQPDFTLGITNNLTYKNFALSFFVYWVKGVTKRNTLITTNDFLLRRRVYNVNYWSPENPTNDFPENADRSTNPLGAGWYEDASFVKLKDVTLSYKMPATVLEKMSLSKLEVFVNAKNLITLTDWRGIDPESSSQTNRPFARTYILGLRVAL